MVKISYIFGAFLNLLCNFSVLGVSIQFYKGDNFTGLYHESHNAKTCTNFPGNVMPQMRSLLTNTCVIVYQGQNCTLCNSKKFLPSDDLQIIGTGTVFLNPGAVLEIGSFQACNKNEGGPQLNVDITEYFYGGIKQAPGIIESYQNICDCVNIPKYLLEMHEWSIDNHHNKLLLYYEPNCSEDKYNARKVRAGHNWNTRSNFVSSIQSLGPDPDSAYFNESCANVYEVSVKPEYLRVVNSTWKQENGDFEATNSHYSSRIYPQIHFFTVENFKDFLSESNVTTTCSNIFDSGSQDVDASKIITSIKTDACVMLYSEENCLGRSIKLETGQFQNLTSIWESTVTGAETLTILYNLTNNWIWKTASFHGCNIQEAGPQLNVDITEYSHQIHKIPKVFQSYPNICYCQNIPKNVRDLNKWTLNNHGNSLMAYFEQDCSSIGTNPLVIPPGRNLYSMEMGAFRQTREKTGIVHSIVSFGPDAHAEYFTRNCVKLSTTIFKFEVFETEVGFNLENVEMEASKSDYYNDSPAQVKQTFTASKVIRQSYSIDIGLGLSKMSRVQVDRSFDIESRKSNTNSQSSAVMNSVDARVSASVGVSAFGFESNVQASLGMSSSTDDTSAKSVTREAGFREGLRKAYEFTESQSFSQNNERTEETTRTFSKSQEIVVPPCTEATVHAYVKMITRGPTKFRALAKISGEIGRRRMTAEQVHKYMDSSLEYVEDFDDSRVLAYLSGSFRAEYGVSAFIQTRGARIAECVERLQLSGCPVCSCEG